MSSKPTASLSVLHHRNGKHIKVTIANTPECKARIRQVKGRKWSKTHQCWYVPYCQESYRHLQELFDIKIETDKKEGNGNVQTEPNSGGSISLHPQFSEYQKDDEVKRKVVGDKIWIKEHGSDWILAFVPYDKTAWVYTVKNIYGRKWNLEKTAWMLPYVKSTFYHIKNHIGLENVHFDFKIKKDIPKQYTPKTKDNNIPKTKKQNTHDQLTPEQKRAIIKLEEQLILRQYSYSTMRSYRNHLCGIFAFHEKKNPEELQPHNVEKYLLHLIRFKKIAESTQNQIINAYKAYVEKVLGRPKEWVNIPRPKKPKQLPNVLSEGEVARLIKAATNIKHKLILLLIYSAGLRLSEVVNLRIRDINVDRRAIFIKAGKGKKDRYVVLAESVIPYLNKYRSENHLTYWLFEGQHGGQYSKRSVQSLFRTALMKSKINAYATVHTLRHSYATHCVQNGFSLALIQEALGHESLKTTERYLHVSSQALTKLKSPLDILKNKMRE